MKIRKGIIAIFSLLLTFNGLAQQKTIREEIQELQELIRRQNENLGRSQRTDSTRLEIEPEEKQTIEIKPVEKQVEKEQTAEIQPATSPSPVINAYRKNVWSLEECIQHAIDHNISIQQLQLRQEEAEIQQNTAKNSRLPNLNASMGLDWNYGKTEDLMNEFIDYNLSNTSINAQSIFPIFTGFRIPNQIERTKLEVKAATQNLEKAKEDLSIHITSLFLQALFFKELLNISQQQLELSNTQVERTQLLIQAGNIPKSQLYDIEAQVAKDEVVVVNALNDLELALLDLAQSLELERNTDFDIYIPNIEGDIISMYMRSLQSPDIIYENALNIKPVIKGQEYRVESSKKALKIAEAGYYPQLDFMMGIGTRYHHIYKPSEQVNPITLEPVDLNPSLSTQMKNYGARFFGFNLSIPIFNRYQVRNQVSSAKIEILNQQLILENNKKTLYKEIQTAYKNATAAQNKYRASERAVKSANESFEYVRRRYETGNATVFEFNEARTRLIQSQSEQVQAKYEFILKTKILDFYNGVPIRL